MTTPAGVVSQGKYVRMSQSPIILSMSFENSLFILLRGFKAVKSGSKGLIATSNRYVEKIGLEPTTS